MTDASALFIDTNILVYANIKESPFHKRALQALQAAHQNQRPLWLSRQVLREYLVTMTHPQTFGSLSQEMVLNQVMQFSQSFYVADDTPAVTQHLLSLIQQYRISGKQIHDANIVATMMDNDITCLLTHNTKDFSRFKAITIESIGE